MPGQRGPLRVPKEPQPSVSIAKATSGRSSSGPVIAPTEAVAFHLTQQIGAYARAGNTDARLAVRELGSTAQPIDTSPQIEVRNIPVHTPKEKHFLS